MDTRLPKSISEIKLYKPKPYEGVKKFQVHKNLVSPNYSLAQDDYATYLKRALNLNAAGSQLKSKSKTNFDEKPTRAFLKKKVTELPTPPNKVRFIPKLKSVEIQCETTKESANFTLNQYHDVDIQPSLADDLKSKSHSVRSAQSFNFPNENKSKLHEGLKDAMFFLKNPQKIQNVFELPNAHHVIYSKSNPKIFADNPVIGYGKEIIKYQSPNRKSLADAGAFVIKSN